MSRLFIAIDLDSEMKKDLSCLQRSISGLKWVSREQLHITLQFLGDVDEDNIEILCQNLAEVKFYEFNLHLEGVGFFPNARRPSVFWCGIQPLSEIVSLHDEISRILGGFSWLDLEKRSFKPHLTLARIKDRLQKKNIEALHGIGASMPAHELTVKSFNLYSSILCSHGAEHQILKTISSI